nr:MAG TPA: Baseplate structural protein [Herelleviridae sp.]
MKTYFDYEGIIKSKDAAEAIAAPIGIGPFCGFGSAVITNNAITISPNGEPTSPAYLAMKDRIVTRYMTKASDSGEGPEVNFGCIARDGMIFISDAATISIPNIEGSKGSNEDVIVFAYHTPLEEPVQNPVQFRAFWNESNSFYSLYKKSVDPLYPSAKDTRNLSKINVLEDTELTYESLANRAMASVAQGLVDKSSMVLVGIYGQGINSMDNTVEKYSIVPYGGRFPQPVEYNTAIHGMQQSNVETLLRLLQGFPNFDIKAYIDEKLGNMAGSNIPRGLIAMWNGTQVPNGWALCNGQIVDDLQTPDLSGKFVVGWQSGNEDYNLIGNTGGQDKVTLTTPEIPSHVHNFADAYFIEAYDGIGINGSQWIGNNLYGSSKTDRDNSYVALWDHDTRAAGGGQPHENRPPYYVLAYIIKL